MEASDVNNKCRMTVKVISKDKGYGSERRMDLKVISGGKMK